MRVRMRRRYRDGVKLTATEFSEQPWNYGMLQLSTERGRDLLGLYEAAPGHMTPPFGELWRPELVACYSDTISFSGIEKSGRRWVQQTWFCEVNRSSAPVT